MRVSAGQDINLLQVRWQIHAFALDFHLLKSSRKESIDANYVADILPEDWGFYWTVTPNLKKIREVMPNYEALAEEDRKDVNSKIENLLSRIEEKPKSMRWKMRAKIGTKKKWYTNVDAITE